ncbi:MAG TPA: DUF885 family protein, partial [Candidatus Polarisedimenticolia bacterium]|nr:DUF885 family protein [Candidatus Polarisedimenticolia bacterium]
MIRSLPRPFVVPLLVLPALLAGCEKEPPKSRAFRDLREEYFLGFLKNSPVTSTYLGGDGYSPALSSTSHRLKDYSPAGLKEETTFYRRIRDEMAALPTATLSSDEQVDRSVMAAQIAFLLRQTEERKYYQRSLDTYVVEPFRGVDWQMQQMTDLGGGNAGTEAEWTALVERVKAIPAYLAQATRNIREGVSVGNFPDRRMVETDGIRGSESNADYFARRLPEQARSYLSRQPYGDRIASALAPAAAAAGEAYTAFARDLTEIFVERRDGGTFTFQERFREDRFAASEKEYDWALENNLK